MATVEDKCPRCNIVIDEDVNGTYGDGGICELCDSIWWCDSCVDKILEERNQVICASCATYEDGE